MSGVSKPKRTHPIYNSTRWKELRAKMQRTHRRCHDCARTNTRLYADHVIELVDGGAPFDPANVVMRCARCHALKTQQERERRRANGGYRAGGGGEGPGTRAGSAPHRLSTGVFFSGRKSSGRHRSAMELALANVTSSTATLSAPASDDSCAGAK